MKTVLNSKGYGIPRTDLSKEYVIKLKEELTVKPNIIPDYDFGTIDAYPVYRFNNKYFYVPKFWGIQNHGIPTERVDKHGNSVDHQFKGSLRDHQIKFTNCILNEIKKNDSCIACSSTGSGKTVMSLWLISQLRKRTLILVHKTFLMDQWLERISQFLPNASVGIIKQDKFEIDNDIIVGMIQTIVKRKYDKGVFDSVGMYVVDETHHLGSHTFSKIPYIIGSKYSLGLSATPKRKDGLTKVIEWFLGPIICNKKESDVDIPSVKFIHAQYSSTLKPKYNWKNKLITANMETQIAADDGRTLQIIKEIKFLRQTGRKILVLSSRRAHCERMEELLDAEEFTIGLYLGGMKESQLTESNKCDVILATYNMAYEGYDNPDLDTLILATGRGDIEQACGRILRRRNKFKPLIVDVTDTEYFGGQLRRRKMFYKKKGYSDHESGDTFKDHERFKSKAEIPDEIMF